MKRYRKSSRPAGLRTLLLRNPLLLGFVAGLSALFTQAPLVAAAGPTYSKDVAPILFANCVACHRAGEVAPMSLLTYEQVRPWAKSIKSKVVAREMPPWNADPQYGKFANDKSLTAAQIATITSWVDDGAPRGDPADTPVPPRFANDWEAGIQPDYVIEMPLDYPIPATGEIPYVHFWVPIPFHEERFVETVEVRPGNRSVVHHAAIYVRDIPAGATVDERGELTFADGVRQNTLARERRDGTAPVRREGNLSLSLSDDDMLAQWLPGGGITRRPPGTGRRLSPGKYVMFQMHYQSPGSTARDRSRIGLWFSKSGRTHEMYQKTVGFALPTEPEEKNRSFFFVKGNGEPAQYLGFSNRLNNWPPLLPNQEDFSAMGVTAITEPITVYALQPHMHLRGKSQKFVLTRPDGRQEVLLNVPKYDFNWQIIYYLAEPLKIPAGSTLSVVSIWDNSSGNRFNPAPDQKVFWAEQSWDEMYTPYMWFTVDSEDPKLTKASATPASRGARE
jgi:copper type II ascorbate-dependent monooxygenase-like protein